MTKNYYGSLCTEMYEILHKEAPQDELDFYLSYAEKGMSILEPLCGSGRFFIPFLKKGFDISGIDLSAEMLAKLKQKAPDAKVIQENILEFNSGQSYDYIFIPSGSLSLFTDLELCKAILLKLRNLLKNGGKLVFAIDTIADRCPDDTDYRTAISVKTEDGLDLILKSKNYYDEKTNTQFSPGIYELYDGTKLLQQEAMDFQTHLYNPGEMEQLLQKAGFTVVKAYSSYQKNIAAYNQTEAFLYECSFDKETSFQNN